MSGPRFVYNDGGRAEAGFKGTTSDCVPRAIAIAARLPYLSVYEALNALAKRERRGKRKRGVSSSRTGVYRTTYERFLRGLGWQWTPTMRIGSGCTVHLRAEELPAGPLVAILSGHLTAVLDGVVHDTYDPSRDGTRCVYGYWRPPVRHVAEIVDGRVTCRAEA